MSTQTIERISRPCHKDFSIPSISTALSRCLRNSEWLTLRRSAGFIYNNNQDEKKYLA